MIYNNNNNNNNNRIIITKTTVTTTTTTRIAYPSFGFFISLVVFFIYVHHVSSILNVNS